MQSPLPSRLVHLYEAYQSSRGNYLLHGPYLTENWLRIADSYGASGDRITRETICESWTSACTEDGVLRALFLTMVWGYGSTRFGRRNTRLALKSAKDGKWRKLSNIRELAIEDASKGLRALSDLRIKGLGLAFHTKILYGMTGAIPILDRHTRAWLAYHGFEDVNRAPTEIAEFDSYLETCRLWAELPIGTTGIAMNDPCLVEYLMFWDAKRGRRLTASASPEWLKFVKPWDGRRLDG